jgi:hypothetical protein
LELCTEGTMPTYEANRLKSPQNLSYKKSTVKLGNCQPLFVLL